MIRTHLANVKECVGRTHRPPKLPEGYRMDLASDPDSPVLRRPDGSVGAHFSARGMTYEAIEREALEDLLLRTSQESGGGDPIRSKDPEGYAPPNL